ncbi:MAG: hypothetical protein ABI700_29980 [Chloroflexota bacterium]
MSDRNAAEANNGQERNSLLAWGRKNIGWWPHPVIFEKNGREAGTSGQLSAVSFQRLQLPALETQAQIAQREKGKSKGNQIGFQNKPYYST